QYQVFTEFRKVEDTSGSYARLNEYLEGRGVPDMEDAMVALRLRPIHEAFGRLISAGSHGSFTTTAKDYSRLVGSVRWVRGVLGEKGALAAGVKEDVVRWSSLLRPETERRHKGDEGARDPLRLLRTEQGLTLLISWIFNRRLGGLISATDIPRSSAELFDRL